MMGGAYFRATVSDFVRQDPSSIFRALSLKHGQDFHQSTAEAAQSWWQSIQQLQVALGAAVQVGLPDSSTLFLEYSIPRLRSRIDGVLVVDGVVFIFEIKSGGSASLSEARVQVRRYRQDLKDFHEESREAAVVPIALATSFPAIWRGDNYSSRDVVHTNSCNFECLPEVLTGLLREVRGCGKPVSAEEWHASRYFPVPPIVEAVIALHEQNDIREIAHSHAGEEEVGRAVAELLEISRVAKERSEKVLVVLTGVPGAGKTLVGLSSTVEISKALSSGERQVASFMSGNGPLVRVLQEVLCRWLKGQGRASRAKSVAASFIKEMHLFIGSELYQTERECDVNVVVFDEAQRAWSAEHNAEKANKFAKGNTNPGSGTWSEESEAHQILRIMDRKDWAVVVALVGSGQEIHKGEAGLSAWGRAVSHFPHWNVIASRESVRRSHVPRSNQVLDEEPLARLELRDSLHLSVSKRSFEAENHAQWVNRLLANDLVGARRVAEQGGRPVLVSRDLSEVRRWLWSVGDGVYRPGLCASSGAARLRRYGIEPPTFNFLKGIPYEHWFLDPKEDLRSSYRLEVAMSEFEVQGLELDYVGLCWGGDLIWNGKAWVARKLVNKRQPDYGQVWRPLVDDSLTQEGQTSLTLNKYRVLLTRFRKGLVLFVPPGDNDPTDLAEEFDRLYEALLAAGCQQLRSSLS